MKTLKFIPFLFIFITELAFAKSLYMTVRKDFGPKESPVLEVNYVSSSPLKFRILKPKNLQKFIQDQVDIRRTWKEPEIVENTSRYLLQGINKTHLSFDWMRFGVDSELRESLQDAYGGGKSKGKGTKFDLGPPKFITSPKGFEVVKEFVSAPEVKDSSKPFDVPGYSWWFSRASGLKTRFVNLPQLEPGFYLVQVLQGDLEGQIVVTVNDIMAVQQQTSDKVIVRVSHRDGTPQANAKVSMRNLGGKWVKAGKTNKLGEVSFNAVKDHDLVTLIEGKGHAIIDAEFFPTTAMTRDVFLYSDRPMYKAGDEVHFRGLLRRLEKGKSALTKDAAVKIQLVDLKGAQVAAEKTLNVSAFGSFTGKLKVPDDQGGGVYRLEAQVASASHIGEIRVKEYVKPIFFVEAESAQETIKPGDNLKVSLSTKRYAGGVPSGVTYRWELFKSRMDSPEWVEDAGFSETGSEVTYFWDDRPKKIQALVPVTSGNGEFDGSGNSLIDIRVPSSNDKKNYDFKYILKISAKDLDRNYASASISFLDMESENLVSAKMSAAFATAKHPTKLSIRSVYPSGKAYPSTEGEVVWYFTGYKQNEKKIGSKKFTTNPTKSTLIPVPVKGVGRLRAEVTVRDKQGNRAISEAETIVLGADISKGVLDTPEMMLLSRRDYFFPGEEAKGLVVLPEGWGLKGQNAGYLYITVAGKDIYEHRVQKVNGLSTWVSEAIKAEYGTGVYIVVSYPHPHRGWVERKFVYKIPPKDRALRVTLKPGSENVLPGAWQNLVAEVADFKGRPVSAELSISVVDRAVLDLQPEFRPSLIGFFYPQTRLNLMSFFSSQFQSYGYGERIASLFKPNYWYSSSKADPDVLKEKDTAFWKGNLVTNAKGIGQVKFRMPGNQTIWTATAVAADKLGRFGEGTREFKSNMPVSTTLAMPNYLRKEDQLDIRFVVANNESKSPVKVKFLAEPDDKSSSMKPVKFAKALKYKEEHIVDQRLRLVDDSTGRSNLKYALELEGNRMAFFKSLKTLDNRVEQPESLSFDKGNQVFAVGKGEAVKEARVVVLTGLMGSVMPALEWLVRYPYGCVEQTVNSTVPNLLVRDLIDIQKKSSKAQTSGVSKRLEKLTGDTEEYAKAGAQRLKTYQNKDGSFGWWGANGKGNEAMTLFVLNSLASIDNAREYRSIMSQAYNWANRQTKIRNDKSVKGSMFAYISARMNKLGVGYTSSRRIQSQISFQAKHALKASPIERAYLLLAIHNLGSAANNKEMTALKGDLVKQLKRDVGAIDDNPNLIRPAVTRWEAYPGRYASSMALIAHALYVSKALNAKQRNQVIQSLAKRFNGAHYGSTYETANVLIHTKWLLEEDMKKPENKKPPQIVVNNKNVSNSNLQSQATIGGFELVVSPKAFKEGRNKIDIKNVDKYLGADLRLTRLLPPEKSFQYSNGWGIQRKLYQVNEETGKRRELKATDNKLDIGDLVYTEIEYWRLAPKNIKRPNRSSYYFISSQIPAGLTVVEETRKYEKFDWYDKGDFDYDMRQVNLDRVNFFYEFKRDFMSKKVKVGYFTRAQFAGQFTTGAARVEDFYDENLYGQTNSDTIAIRTAKR